MPKSSQRNILLFDLFSTGHHAGYLLHLIKYWQDVALSGSLQMLVTPTFIKSHGDVVAAAKPGVSLVTITPEEEQQLRSEGSSSDRLARSFQEWDLLQKYGQKLQPSHCVLMYLDSMLLALSLKGKPPCPISGIYFRPIFHYGEFADFNSSFKERILQWRDRVILGQLLGKKQFKTLFCLDPFAVERIAQFNTSVEPIYLADPVQIYSNSDSQLKELKASLDLPQDRKVFLMFGVPQGRKGIYQLLEAIALLPVNLAEQFCLLLVGPKSEDPSIHNRISELQQSLPVQIIKREQFIQDQEIQPYFQISDVILAPYQRHIGMSAILVRAAAAQKPVLSCNYGLMGEMVKRYELGITVDASSPQAIAQGINKFLFQSGEILGNPATMKSFAEINTAKNFAKTIFGNIGT